MKFLIQNIGNKSAAFDFVFHLEKAIEYQYWLDENFNVKIEHTSVPIKYVDADDIIPVGSVEFVSDFLQINYGLIPIPLNVPVSLYPYTKRNIQIGELKLLEIKDNTMYYAKSTKKIKHNNNGIVTKELHEEGIWQFSSFIPDVIEEWRGFVFGGKLLDIRRYLNEIENYPDMKFVREVIANYKDAPCSYTIDFGISSSLGTFVIEVHDFFSCGLYGFERYDLLPAMFIRSFFEMKKKLTSEYIT